MGIRKDVRARFLKSLASSGNVSLAAHTSKISRSSLYHWRERDKGFASAWLEAIEVATDALESEARRRAIEGVETTIIHGGRMVRDDDGNPLTIRRYSDTLLALLLRAHRPEKYRDKPALNCAEPDNRNVSFTITIGDQPWDYEPNSVEKGKSE
jgi:hypothetical protein